MNTSLDPQTVPVAPDPPTPASLLIQPGHKRNGKIAHLPKALRDKINQWIDDGHTYPQIIKDLGDDAKDLKPNHFSEWRKGGYQDYLRQQSWRDELRLLRENGADIKEFTDGPQFQETLIQLALTEIFRTLRNHELKSDSLNYIRIFNALAKLNREALGLRKYNDILAKEFQELKKLDPTRDLESERDIMLTALERSMGFPAAPGPIGPDLNEYLRSRRREEADSDTNGSHNVHQPAPQPPQPIENQNSKIENPKEGQGEEVASPSRNTQHETRSDTPPLQISITPSFSSPIKNRKPKIENCLHCFAPLPPLLPSGEHQFPHCQNCGAPLRSPGSLIECCPHCHHLLPELNSAGHRPTPDCPSCLNPLPPPNLNHSQLPDAA
jgi:hypothetical protein